MGKSKRGPRSREKMRETGEGRFDWNRGVKPPMSELTEEEKQERIQNREAAIKRGITLEDKGIKDSKFVVTEELQEELATDEFNKILSGEIETKIMLTTCTKPGKQVIRLSKELMYTIPNIHFYKRRDYPIQAICQYAAHHQFTSVIVVGQQKKRVHGLYICHLPEGPSLFYKLTSLKLMRDLQKMRGKKKEMKLAHVLADRPEVLTKQFESKMGLRASRSLRSLFPAKSDLKARRVVCFMNQRDFIFFRNWRYDFKDTDTKTPVSGLKEIGPRFTLKMRWCHKGLFNANDADYEFLWRPELQVDRKIFFI